MAAPNGLLMLGDPMAMMDNTVTVGLEDVDVDDVDLFGDPVGDLAIPLPPNPTPSKELRQRVDDMRIRGCCQRIAWSKQGTIASISADGMSIELRYLRTHPRDGVWGLSEPTPYSHFGSDSQSVFVGGPVVHLAWSGTGNPELAVVDSVGRVSIITFTTNLNRPYVLRSWDSDPVDDLHTVVGSYWLPLVPPNKQYNVIHGPATREEQGYRYDNTFVHAFGPYHPNPGKSALLCVTAGGMLKLFYAQNNNKLHDTSIELDSITTSDDLTTHASICSEKANTLLIALTSASRQLKVVRAVIHWGLPQQDKQVPPQSMPLNPSMQQKPAAITTWLQHGSGEPQINLSMAKISQVEMLPSALIAANQPWTPPTVLTVRTYLPSTNSGIEPEAQSVIDRWELLVDTPAQPLHPAFELLGIKPPQNASPQGVTRLHRLEPIYINKVIVSVQTIQLGKAICLAFSDGTIQYRDRFTMQELYNEPNPAKIMMLFQANFQFTDPTPCLSVAFSPTNSSFVQISEDGKVKWNSLKYLGPDIGATRQDPDYATAVAGLTTAVSAASSNVSYDDILATARQFIDKPRFAYDWMMEIVRMLKFNVDYSEESHHDQLVRNHSLQLCLSILNHMGFRGEFERKSFSRKFAMLALNVRNIVILITIASNTPTNLKEKLNPLDEPEVVEALAGCAKWALNLLAYISSCVFNLLDDPKFMSLLTNPELFGQVVSYLQERNEVALHLLLCSSTRGFLSAACRRLLHLESISTRATQYYELQQHTAAKGTGNKNAFVPLSLAYQKMQQYTSSSLIKVQEFDKLLLVLGEDIRQIYQSRVAQAKNQAQPPSQQQADAAVKRMQAHCELTLLLANNPPQTFQPMLAKFFNENVRAFRTQTDPAKLFFADYSILEVEDDDRALQEKRAQRRYIDMFKRVDLAVQPMQFEDKEGNAAEMINSSNSPLANTGLWRRCVRCTAVMEDVTGLRPGHTFVLSQQRKCSCGGNWGLLPRGSLVG